MRANPIIIIIIKGDLISYYCMIGLNYIVC